MGLKDAKGKERGHSQDASESGRDLPKILNQSNMKKFVVILFFFNFYFPLSGQCIKIKSSFGNVLYRGIDNIIELDFDTSVYNIDTIYSSSESYKSYKLSNGSYLVKCNSIGEVDMKIRFFNKRDSLTFDFCYSFISKEFPLPTLKLDKYNSGDSILITQISNLEKFNIQLVLNVTLHCKLKSFNAIVINKDLTPHVFTYNKNNNFEEFTKWLNSVASSQCTLLIFNIKISIEGTEKNINSIDFKLM